MRFFRKLSTVALLATGTYASSLDARALLDVCAALDVNLTVPGLLGLPPIVIGKLDLCLCLSALPTFIHTNALAIVAVALIGETAVTAEITALINAAAHSSNCKYPEHSAPACISGSKCGFDCTDGFTPSPASKPTECVCKSPNTVCNGVCGKKACPSGKPKAEKRGLRYEGSGACAAKGEGFMACGVFGGGARAWECVDTTSDLESCGGCALPLTPYTPFGTDCTLLPGVADVSCLSGACVVHRCLPGHARAADASECVRAVHGSISSSKVFKGEEWESEYDVPAGQYGLEHVPLKH